MPFSISRRAAVGGLAGAAFSQGDAAATPSSRAGSALPTDLATTDPNVAAKLAERPSVRDKGARGDGVSMDGAAIQDALSSFDTVWVPPGVYMIDVPLTLPSYCVLEFASDAVFCPAHDGMTVFRTGEVSYASRLLAPRVHARERRDVTAFDLRGFRHRAEIQHADIAGCARGIVLRELCWDTVIYMPWIRHTGRPLVIANGSNAVDVIHPGIDGCDVGISIETGPQHSTTSTRIWGGYVQNGRCGIADAGGIGTVVDGTYFEGFSEADILLTRSVRANLSRTQHYGEQGAVAIKMVEADGATVFDPTMSSGVRTVGLYDIDGASRNVVRFESATAGGVNQPAGNAGNSGRLVQEQEGAFVPALIEQASAVYQERQGRWRRAGAHFSVAVVLRWQGARTGSDLILSGVPMPPAAVPPAALAPAVVEGVGTAYVRLDVGGSLRLVTMENGRERPLPMTASGAVEFMLTCLL